MHRYSFENVEELEPRMTPKPTAKINNFAVPSVPEISLIFDKPVESKTPKHKTVVTSPSVNSRESYAAWRQSNFSTKPSDPEVAVFNKTQCNTPSPQNRSQSRETPRNKSYDKNMRKNVNNNVQCQKQMQPTAYQEHKNTVTNLRYENGNEKLSESVIDANNSLTNSKTYLNMDNHNSYDYKRTLPTVALQEGLSSQNLNQQRLMPNVNGPTNIPHLNHCDANNSSNNMFPLMPHSSHLRYPYPYFDVNTYPPFPPFYPVQLPNSDNHETIKNLLQLVNTQNEQIQSLQTQVDNLIKMQKEALNEKAKCACPYHFPPQQFQVNSCDSTNTPYIAIPQGQDIKRNIYHGASTVETRLEAGNGKRVENQSQMVFKEQQVKEAPAKQDASVGVIPNFEFTVENNPLALDFENHSRETIRQNETENGRNAHPHDSCETLKRNKNSFTRMPSGHLENIVEDSESYLSSSQPQSSNFNISYSTKDLQEKQNQQDCQRAIDIHKERATESPRVFENAHKNTHELKLHKQIYLQKLHDQIEENKQDTQKQVESAIHSPAKHRSYTPDTAVSDPKDCLISSNEDLREKCKSTTKINKCVEDSLILSAGDLHIRERPPLTPERSIHVEMEEYSSDDSESVKQTSKVGWTFYNKVLGQVNQILQNSSTINVNDPKEARAVNNVEQNEIDNITTMDTVRVATLEQLRKLGISLTEKTDSKEAHSGKRVEFDSTFYPRLDYQANITHTTSAITETNTSMHMKALALKYLSEDQFAELALQKQGSTSLKQVMLSNMQGTNMSFATMRYLERYQLLPGKNNIQIDDERIETTPKVDLKSMKNKHTPVPEQYSFTPMPRTSCPSKILDISTLKKQPKLL